MESCHKAMIVISHPWEFVPKGSSHLNYHTNSSTSTSNTTTNITTTTTSNINNNNTKTDNQQQKNTTTTTTITANTLTGGCFVMQEPNQNDKKIGPKKNVRVMINSEFNNSSLNDMSYAYWQKSPVIINKLNFEQQVIVIIFHIFNIN